MKNPASKKHRSRSRGKVQPCATTSAIIGPVALASGGHREQSINPKWLPCYRRLVALHDRLLKDKAGLARDAIEETPAYSMDMADAATDEFDRDLALSKLSAEQDALYEIAEAIHRIQSNAYGICELTGEPIPTARLDAVPWTRFAAQVEARLERQGAVSRPHLGALGSVHGPATGALEESELGEDQSQPSAKDEELWPIYSPPGSHASSRRK